MSPIAGKKWTQVEEFVLLNCFAPLFAICGNQLTEKTFLSHSGL